MRRLAGFVAILFAAGAAYGAGVAGARAGALPAPAADEARTGCLLDEDAEGSWIVTAVVVGSSCDHAGVEPGSIVRLPDGSDEEIDAGPAGSAVLVELRERDGGVRRVTLDRAVLPASGRMRVLRGDGSVAEVAFDPAAFAGAATAEPRRCAGVAQPCGPRGPFECAGLGCQLGPGSCSGLPTTSCFGQSPAACRLLRGCVWRGDACSGTVSCSGSSEGACQRIPGCTWEPRCVGAPVACTDLDEDECGRQPGCALR